MYFPKLLYEEFKKLRKQQKTISKHISKIDREQFLFLKRGLFSGSNFKSLDSTKKLLFSDETDFENQKFIFEELNDFSNWRRFGLASLVFLSAKRLFLTKAIVISSSGNSFNFSLFKPKAAFNFSAANKKIFIKLIKGTLFAAFSFAAFYCENIYFEMEITDKVTIESRLGIYLWFENNYRKGLLNTNTINMLDAYMQKLFITNLLNERSSISGSKELKNDWNQDLFYNVVFYALVKQHFYDVFISKTLQNVIIPLIDYQEKSSRTCSAAFQAQTNKFLLSLLKRNFENRSKERFYCFDSELNCERNLKVNYPLNYLKALFHGDKGSFSGFSDEFNFKGVDFVFDNNKVKNETLFLNENSLGSLLRNEELNQIYFNCFFQEKLRDFYEDYNKNGNI